MVLLDVPHSGRGKKDVAAEAYLRSQMEDLIRTAEDITGRKLDWDKLRGTIRLSCEASALWTRILESATARPSPDHGFRSVHFDAAYRVAPWDPENVDFYRALAEELEPRPYLWA